MNAMNLNSVLFASKEELAPEFPLCDLVHQWDNLTAYWSLSGMRPGKFLGKRFPKIHQATLKDGAEALSQRYSLSFSYEKKDFEDGYTIRSCMKGKGDIGWKAYSRNGVGIFLLRDAEGVPVARSLGFWDEGRWWFVRTYGEAHYNLEALMRLLDIRMASVMDKEGFRMKDYYVKIPIVETFYPRYAARVRHPFRPWETMFSHYYYSTYESTCFKGYVDWWPYFD